MPSKDTGKDHNEDNAHAYVRITCGEPSETGHMEINMTYQGDLNLLSYLLSGAQDVIEQQEAETETESE